MVHERIKILIQALDLTVAKFAVKVGLDNHQTLYKMLNNGTKPSFDTIVSILNFFPEVNPRWLLLGEGEMFDGGVSSLIKEVDTLRAAIADKERIIKLQEDALDRNK